jgi:adenylate kinase family enzyme
MSAKKLVIITGAPGVGKTAVSRALFETLDGCAWLDSDWCWMLPPWHAKSDAQKQHVEDLFGRILRGYLADEATRVVLFSWVMPAPAMFDIIANQLRGVPYEPVRIALVCEAEAHVARMRGDGRRPAQAEHPDIMAPYHGLGAEIIDVTHIAAREAAEQIAARLAAPDL